MIPVRKLLPGRGHAHPVRRGSSFPAVEELALVAARALRLVIPLLTVAVGIASVLLAPRPGAFATTYSGGSGLARAADVVAGLSLLAGGLATSIARHRGSIGIVAMLAGATWFAPDWVGWEGGAPLVRSLGMVVAPFVPALLLHLALAAPDGRLRSFASRGVVVGLYAIAGVASLGLALVRDPFLDRYCWSNCTENVFLVRPEQELARALRAAFLLIVLVGATAVAVFLVRRLAGVMGAARRVVVPAASSGVLLAVALAAYAGALLHDPSESADDTLFATLFLSRAGAATSLALALAWSAYGVWRTRSAVARLAADLGEAPPPGSLRRALADSLGDPELDVAYPIGTADRFVDAAGIAVPAPLAAPDRAVTPIVRDGRHIAVVVHARGAVVEDELARDIGAAARLAVDNERLQAELLARLHDLRASRARIVETGDAARRLLERDLHDGAQQRLLALSYDLRVASSTAQAEGESELGVVLDAAVDEAQAALDELRDLAHGIFPAILAEAGLGPALWGLVDQASIPVELSDPGADRYAPAVETAAYVVVDDAIADAARRTAGHALVRVQRVGTKLVVEIEDDGVQSDTVPVHLADRAGALGGRVERAGHVLRAELPCA